MTTMTKFNSTHGHARTNQQNSRPHSKAIANSNSSCNEPIAKKVLLYAGLGQLSYKMHNSLWRELGRPCVAAMLSMNFYINKWGYKRKATHQAVWTATIPEKAIANI